MTASPHRRRRSTAASPPWSPSVSTLASPPGWPSPAALTLYNSTEGTSSQATVPRAGLPGHADGGAGSGRRRRRAGVAGGARRFAGWDAAGASCTIPVSSRRRRRHGGRAAARSTRPFRLDGATSLENEVEVTLGLGIDAVEVVDEARLTELLDPIGPIDVDLPDAGDGRRRASDRAGRHQHARAGRGSGDPDGATLPTSPASRPLPRRRSRCGTACRRVGDGCGDPSPAGRRRRRRRRRVR